MSKFFFVLLFTICSLVLKAQSKATFEQAVGEYEAYEDRYGDFIKTDNGLVHYLEWGNVNDPAFIWVHGSFTNAYEIKPFAEDLAAAGYRLIAIDYYGHGKTPIPGHEVSLYHVADDIKALIESKGIEKAVIGGWSRGGFIATAFYDAYPEKVSGLILEDGGSVATNSHYHQMEPQALSARVKSFFEERYFDQQFNSREKAFKALYIEADGGTQFESLAWISQTTNGKWAVCPGVEALFNMADTTQFMNTVIRPTRATLFGQSMSMMSPQIIYRNLHVPMLILDPVSDDDFFPFESQNEALKALHPGLINHVIFKQTGHNIHYEKPEAFKKEVIGFLTILKNR